MKYFAIAIGGSFGAILRYLVALNVQKYIKPEFPLGTFMANIIGCFFIGFFFEFSEIRNLSPNLRMFIMVGLLGSFTTFSTFSLESLNLLKSQQYFYAFSNIIGSIILGLIGVFVGIKCCQLLFG